MPALNFQARFAPLVESGEKRQTIRAFRKDGRDPKPGDTLYLYTGMRTKACRLLGEARCSHVKEVTLLGLESPDTRVEIRDLETLATVRLDDVGAEEFARDDGFSNYEQMRDWFIDTRGLPFTGLLICWSEGEAGG